MDGGYAAESEVRRLAAGIGLADDRLELPLGVAQRRAATPGRAGAHPVRRQRRPDARRAHEPPRRRCQGLDARLHPVLPGRAAGHQPRPRPARRGHHPRPAPRPRRRGRHRDHGRVQGHVLAVPGAAGEGRGPAGQAGGRAGEGDRPAADDRGPLRRQGHEGVHGPQHREAHRPPAARRARLTAGPSRAQPEAAEAAARRSHGASRRPTSPSRTRASTSSRTCRSTSAEASA